LQLRTRQRELVRYPNAAANTDTKLDHGSALARTDAHAHRDRVLVAGRARSRAFDKRVLRALFQQTSLGEPGLCARGLDSRSLAFTSLGYYLSAD
jgi:hypothetical protein